MPIPSIITCHSENNLPNADHKVLYQELIFQDADHKVISCLCNGTDNFDGTSLLAINKLAQNRTIESDLEKCPNCSVLRLHNQDLEEALRKATTMSTADTLHSTSSSNEVEILNLDFSLPYQYIQQHMAAEYELGKSKVWFCIKISFHLAFSNLKP